MAPSHGSSSHPRSQRRPPPLLVLAAAGLAAVVGVGAVLILSRAGQTERRRPESTAVTAAQPSTGDERRAVPAREPTARATNETGWRSPTPTPTPTPTAPTAESVEAQIAATGEIPPGTPPEHLPIWARPPRVTSQPFPEGGRINPPLPPAKIPPEMLVPLPGADPAR